MEFPVYGEGGSQWFSGDLQGGGPPAPAPRIRGQAREVRSLSRIGASFSGSLVALSGGVDSSAALALAIRKGGRVRAVHLDLTGSGGDPSALDVADAAGIPLIRIDASDRFHQMVRLPSLAMLRSGLTPNPCAICNREVKLGILHGMLDPDEELVTGHYAGRSPRGVTRGLDRFKDQSYFLALIGGEVAGRCSFPLGRMTKGEVRELALSQGCPFRDGESMDLCFDLSDLLPDRGTGPVVDVSGRILGEHQGAMGYTVGQRCSIGGLSRRLYVLEVDPACNTLVAGEREELLSHGCEVTGCSWFDPAGPPADDPLLQVQTRYRRAPVKASLIHGEKGEAFRAVFARPEEAVAPGQVCAVYLQNELLGGGMISSAFREDHP